MVLRGPLENGEQVLKPKVNLHEPCLVLEPVKWIIREEDLREPVPEFLQGGALRWQANLVDFQRRHCYLSLEFDGGGEGVNSIAIGAHTHCCSGELRREE